MEFKRISIDTSKHVFTLHGVDGQDRLILRREIQHGKIEEFFARLTPTEVVLEACAGAHHWGRVFGAMGHRVKLIPPQYVMMSALSAILIVRRLIEEDDAARAGGIEPIQKQ